MSDRYDLPGSRAEKDVQEQLGTEDRADGFYENAMRGELNERMIEFVEQQPFFWLSTTDEEYETDCSFRAGPRGFVNVLEPDRLAYPEYRGNGVQASLGNMLETATATLYFIDFFETTLGLHINGEVELHEERFDDRLADPANTDRRKMWVELEVEEAYIHCAKHIPKMKIEEFDPPWGTDDPELKKVGYFAND
jgi:predicted pyridoxine 5'-phosphate oxidase superfamily flavin-nucleotide-binding protein